MWNYKIKTKFYTAFRNQKSQPICFKKYSKQIRLFENKFQIVANEDEIK